ncbi:hypothetical protein HU200_026817 [Digitaria exilis]|uniref:KOW domain-containing protein n=1 Tax=Digitaria exilis TaxID=1010633 RepID=A0A835C2P2_9POAL|nr:hypothetical protein HU200_026817 [Digitaria exilis]
MAVKGKGKQVAAEPPGPGAAGASGSGGKRRKGSGDAGPSSSSAAKRRRRAGVLRFVDDAAGVDEDYEEEDVLESEEEASDPDDGEYGTGAVPDSRLASCVCFFTGGEHVQNLSHKRTERSHPLPFLVKEEELSGDELEEFIRNRYSSGVKYAADRNYVREDDDDFPMDDALKEPTIWRVKCMVVPIITAFALDHVRGFVFVEAEKACDVTEACKGFCSVYASRITSVPAAEVPSLLSSRTKPFEISRGTWVRMKNGNYKGDLAQGGAISLREAAVPAPRFFRPHIEMKRDRQTGEVYEVLDSLMFKDGFLYKRVALSSLIYWGIQPTETELLKFSSSPINRASADDLDWVSSIYGPKKRNLPAERNITSSSKMKSSKTSKASTSTENLDDNDDFNLHDLVLFGRKDFGVIIAIEKDGFRILKGGPEGSAMTVRKQDIKKGCVDKMFTAVDRQKKIISINDTVNVLEGPFQGKQGVVKHLYMGILFIYNESESENCGFFCAQCGSCENVKKQKDLGSSTSENLDNPIPMFAGPSYEQNEHRNTERPYRSTREQLFSVGQMLRIKKGPLKGYLCRVVKIFRNDVTVKLDSLLKIVTVQAEFLSVPANRGDNSSGAPAGNFGSQNTSFFGSEADKTSWDNGLPSFGSDSWQPFSSSTLPAGGESEIDPWGKKSSADGESDSWGKKTDGDPDPCGDKAMPSADGDPDPWGNKAVPPADGNSDAWGNKVVAPADGNSDAWGNKVVAPAEGDSDPWGKKVVAPAEGDSDPWGKKVVVPTDSSAVGVWNTSATQKESSSDNAWDKQAGIGGSEAAAGSWDGITINNESEKSDNWGEACRAADMGTGGDTDPWGSKVKAVDTEGNDNWEKATMPPENKLEGVSQRWGQPLGKSNEDQEKDNISKVTGNNGAWGTALPVNEDGTWGKSKDINGGGAGGWNEARPSDKNGSTGGWDASAANWNKSSAVAEAQEDGWGKGKGASDQAGCGGWNKPKSFGGDGSSSWNKGEETKADGQDNSWSRPGNFGGGRGFGRGQGRRGQESGDLDGRNDQGSWKSSWGGDNAGGLSWRSDGMVDNEVGGPGGYRGRGRGGRGQYGGRGRGRDNGWRNNDRSNSGFGTENDSANGQKWGNGGSSDWNATNPPSNQPWSSSGGTKSYGENKPSTWNSSEDNKPSVGEQDDPWASKVASTEVVAGTTPRQKTLLVKSKKLILGQARALHLRRKLMIPGVVKEGLITSKKLILIAGVLAPQVGTRSLLGANQISLQEARSPLGTSQGLVMIMVEMVGVDLDVDIAAEGEEGILGIVDPCGMQGTEMMNQAVKGLKRHGTGGISMVAEEEAEAVLGEVIETRVTTTLDQEMVAVGALTGEMVTVVVTETGVITISKGLSVMAVAGLPIGMPTKEAAKEVKLLRKASPAGKAKIRLVETVREERVTQTTPGARTDHLPLSWVSQAVILTSLAHGVLLAVELEVPGEKATKIAGTLREQPTKRSRHGEVGRKLLRRKMMMAHGEKAVRGVAAKEVAVPGTKRRMVRGTATRVVMSVVADGERATQ